MRREGLGTRLVCIVLICLLFSLRRSFQLPGCITTPYRQCIKDSTQLNYSYIHFILAVTVTETIDNVYCVFCGFIRMMKTLQLQPSTARDTEMKLKM